MAETLGQPLPRGSGRSPRARPRLRGDARDFRCMRPLPIQINQDVMLQISRHP